MLQPLGQFYHQLMRVVAFKGDVVLAPGPAEHRPLRRTDLAIAAATRDASGSKPDPLAGGQEPRTVRLLRDGQVPRPSDRSAGRRDRHEGGGQGRSPVLARARHLYDRLRHEGCPAPESNSHKLPGKLFVQFSGLIIVCVFPQDWTHLSLLLAQTA